MFNDYDYYKLTLNSLMDLYSESREDIIVNYVRYSELPFTAVSTVLDYISETESQKGNAYLMHLSKDVKTKDDLKELITKVVEMHYKTDNSLVKSIIMGLTLHLTDVGVIPEEELDDTYDGASELLKKLAEDDEALGDIPLNSSVTVAITTDEDEEFVVQGTLDWDIEVNNETLTKALTKPSVRLSSVLLGRYKKGELDIQVNKSMVPQLRTLSYSVALSTDDTRVDVTYALEPTFTKVTGLPEEFHLCEELEDLLDEEGQLIPTEYCAIDKKGKLYTIDQLEDGNTYRDLYMLTSELEVLVDSRSKHSSLQIGIVRIGGFDEYILIIDNDVVYKERLTEDWDLEDYPYVKDLMEGSNSPYYITNKRRVNNPKGTLVLRLLNNKAYLSFSDDSVEQTYCVTEGADMELVYAYIQDTLHFKFDDDSMLESLLTSLFEHKESNAEVEIKKLKYFKVDESIEIKVLNNNPQDIEIRIDSIGESMDITLPKTILDFEELSDALEEVVVEAGTKTPEGCLQIYYRLLPYLLKVVFM